MLPTSSREKKADELGEHGIFTNIDRVNVVQESRAFSDTPLSPKRCVAILAKVLYLQGQGEQFNEKESTTVFFASTKSFQCKDLSKKSQDRIIVTSSLTQDMNKLDPVYKAGAIRALGTIIDGSMVQSIERFIKTAMADRNGSTASAALVTGIHLFETNKDVVRRWAPEVQQALTLAPPKSITQYHALALAYLVKQGDRMAVMKLVHQMQSSPGNPLALCLFLRIYGSILAKDAMAIKSNPLDLKPYLRFKGKNEMVALESARIICEFSNVYGQDVVYAVTALQSLLSSSKSLLKFASIRILSQLAMKYPDKVSPANVEIEQLVTDGNRNIATLAITTLLKTGNEGSVDRLLKQITMYVSEISDEFKVIVVDAVRSLCLKFPAKHASMLEFFGRVLREEGGLTYKEATIESICGLIEKIPSCKEIGTLVSANWSSLIIALSHLCEFIEDCEYPQLIVRIVHLLGEEGANMAQPSKIVRYIYNRLVLENVRVRIACIDALVKIAIKQPALSSGIVKIIVPLRGDSDDETRDAAVIGLSLIANAGSEDTRVMTDFERSFDLEHLEHQLSEYLSSNDFSHPFDMSRVPELTREEQFASAQVEKSLEQLVPAAALSASPSSMGSSAVKFGLSALEIEEMFSGNGQLIKPASDPVPLTDSNAEYTVSVVKHWFESVLVLEYIIANTVPELLLKDVKVAIDYIDSADFKPKSSASIPFLSYKDGPQSALVALQYDLTHRPVCAISSSLRYSLIECELDDPAGNLGEYVQSQRGTSETYSLSPFEVTFADYVVPSPVSNFDTEWNKLEMSDTAAELAETFSLTAFAASGAMADAVDALVSAFGAAPIANTESVDPFALTHTILLSGRLLYPAGQFMCRCRLSISQPTGCVLELTVRSPASRSVCEALIEAVN